MNESPSIAIVAALRDEVAFIQPPPEDTIVCVTGIGRERVRQSIEQLLDTYPTIKRVQLIGFAGGLDPVLKTGQAVRINRVLHENDPPIHLDTGDTTLLTVNQLAHDVETKQQLRHTTGADVVDMETYHAAAILQQRGIAMTVIRAVTDPADVALPQPSTAWVKPDGSADVAAAMRYLLIHPWQLPTLMRLDRASKSAARALAEAIRDL